MIKGKEYVGKNIWTIKNGKKYKFDIVVQNKELDYAILTYLPNTKQMKYDGKKIELYSAKKLRFGDMTFSVGNMSGIGIDVTQGIISKKYKRNTQYGEGFFAISNHILPGNSGGGVYTPVISKEGPKFVMVGLTQLLCGISKYGEGIGYIRGTDIILDDLKKRDIKIYNEIMEK
jgi:hypothetical protein